MLWPGSSHARDRAGTVFHAHTFSTGSSEKKPDGWACWSHRDESRPDFFVAENPSLGGDGSLGISGASNISAHGCWYTVVEGIKPGEHYRLEAFYRIEGVSCPRRQVWSRLNWRDDEGKRVDYPEYVPDAGTQGLWRKVAGIYQAPEGAAKVRIELFLSFCPQGTVWWDGITLDRVPAPSKRLVRVGTANCRPGGNSSVEENIEEFCRVLDEAGGKGCDIVCLSEAITKVGITPTLSFLDIAEPVPGPTTERLGEMAAKYKMYIVAGIVEKEHGAIYNIAVLIDRSGKVAGKYRKTTLPFGESEGGVAPGNSFPVFDTDFGRVGMMICWDSRFNDVARGLALKGAEIIFHPIWGGSDVLTQARALENQVYLVSSGYDIASNIYNPLGEVIADAVERPSVAVAEIDLSKKFRIEWVGDMRDHFLREVRADIPIMIE